MCASAVPLDPADVTPETFDFCLGGAVSSPLPQLQKALSAWRGLSRTLQRVLVAEAIPIWRRSREHLLPQLGAGGGTPHPAFALGTELRALHDAITPATRAFLAEYARVLHDVTFPTPASASSTVTFEPGIVVVPVAHDVGHNYDLDLPYECRKNDQTGPPTRFFLWGCFGVTGNNMTRRPCALRIATLEEVVLMLTARSVPSAV